LQVVELALVFNLIDHAGHLLAASDAAASLLVELDDALLGALDLACRDVF